MIRFFSILLILLAMVCLVVTTSHKTGGAAADFTFSLGDDIESLDPAQMVYHDEMRIGMGLWEGLACYDPKTSVPIPGVAMLPPHISDDALTYIFSLRPDARWSNGDPVTAADFVYAWRRAIEPGSAGDYAFFITDNIVNAKAYQNWRLDAVRTLGLLRDLANNKNITPDDRNWLIDNKILTGRETQKSYPELANQFRQQHLANIDRRFDDVGVKALDDHHLKIVLNQPLPYFVDITCMSVFFPLHSKSLELLRITDDPTVTDLTLVVYDPQWVKPDYHKNGYPGLMTNGEYFLKERLFKQYLLMQKNPNYWDRDNVRSERVMAKVIPTPGTTFLAYEKGDLDIFYNVDRIDFAPTLLEQTRAGTRNDIHVAQAFGTYYYCFNCRPTLPDGRKNPFADPRVRMAFNLAVNKQAIVDNVQKNGNLIARNFVPPNSIPGYTCPPGPDYDPEKAKSLIADAGYPNAKNLPSIELLFNTGYFHDSVAQAVAEMWSKNLNAHVLLVGKEIKSYEDDRKNLRYMVCRSSWYGDYLDPTTFLETLSTGNGNNKGDFSYKPYDDLIRQAASVRHPAERFALLTKAEQIVNDQQTPILPIFYYINLHAYRPNVEGFYANPRDMHPFKYIFVKKP